MLKSERLSKDFFTTFMASGSLNQEPPLSITLCSNTSLLKLIHDDMKSVYPDNRVVFAIKDARNFLFKIDEDLLRIFFVGFLKLMKTVDSNHFSIAFSSSVIKENLLFSFHFPLKLNEHIISLLNTKKLIIMDNSDKSLFSSFFVSGLNILEKHFGMKFTLAEDLTSIVFSFPVKNHMIDDGHITLD